MNRSLYTLIAVLFTVVFLATTVSAQEPADAEHGKEVFNRHCAPCHARGPGNDGLEMLPAPTALTIKYRGALSPYIEERKDLANATVLTTFIRNGVVSMPPFRKTEISDSDIDDLAAYISEASKGY